MYCGLASGYPAGYPTDYPTMILACELCTYDERLRFRYATAELFREHLELVHGIRLDVDGRSIKAPTDPIADAGKPEPPPSSTPKPRR